MSYIIVYRTGKFEAVVKNDIKSAFAIPGDYYVFQKEEMIEQYGRSYKDPFIYLNPSHVPDRFIIHDLELVDIELVFTYNSNFNMRITLYDSLSKSTKKITRSGLNHTKAFPEALSFLVETMSSFHETKSWELLELKEENRNLKNELENLKKALSKQT